MAEWAELSSAERLDAVLLAIAELCDERRTSHAAAVALRVSREHPMALADWGKAGRGNGLRRMSTATRVTPAIMGLRKRGLVVSERRLDGYSGGQDAPTEAGWARVRELRAGS